MQDNIRIFDFKMSRTDREILHKFVDQIVDEGHLSNHLLVKKVEANFASWSNTDYVVAVNNGSSALIAALQAISEYFPMKKRKVLLPSNTFIACWYAVIQSGFEPVLMDSSSSFLGYNLEAVKKEINQGDVAAVLIVHIGGIIDPSTEALVRLCKGNDVLVIEDAAHAHGSHLNGKSAGCLGDISTFSFHLTKAITGGEGGAVCTSNKKLHDLLLSIRQFGKSDKNPHLFERVGGNYKMSEMQAAFLLTDLTRARSRIQRRQEIAGIYFNELKNSSLQFLRPTEGSESSYYKCIGVLRGETRDELIATLAQNNIQMPNGVYYWPLHQQPVVKNTSGKFPHTDKFSRQHICLPCYPELTNEQVHYFIDVFKRCENAGLV